MAERKSLSKSLRFEIFKRDGFRCLYCGATPVQKVLRVDHVVPVAGGGSDDPSNLVTSCFDCNAGKSATPLEHKKYEAGIATEYDKEHAEQIREWLSVQREIQEARRDVADQLLDIWSDALGGMSEEMYRRLPKLASEWPIERLVQAINITAAKFGRMAEYKYREAKSHQKYFSAVLRNWRQTKEETESPKPAYSFREAYVALGNVIWASILSKEAADKDLTEAESAVADALRHTMRELDAHLPGWRDE